jgi:hypothetical protein
LEVNEMSSPVPVLGRNARLFRGTQEIGYGKNITTEANAEEIKVYSMDSLQPVISAAGKQSFKWSIDRLFTDKTYIASLISGDPFDLVFAPEGEDDGDTIETWKNCRVLHRGIKAGEDDGILESISGSAETVEFPAPS